MPFHDDEYDNGRSGGLVAKQGAGDNAAPLSISEISALLKRTVEDRFGYVRLRGELSGVKRAASGHLYCALKDDKAVIDGVMWRGGAQRLAFRPEDGIEVIASGKLTTYPGRSKYQIVIESMEIAGEGALLALLEKLRARLAEEGLFAPERKRVLPFLPGVIGVVTSPTGAVIRDILHRLADRFPSHVLVWPVLVQGEGAAQQVADAVRGFSGIAPGGPVPRPDLVIVARGGGSIEDLWSFNEEAVVRAVAESTIPVISAVGHETDTTLCDYAADRRAPTPTAAAEIAVPVRAELMAQLDELALRKRRCALRPVALGRERLEARVQRLPRPDAILAARVQKLDELSERLRRGLQDQERGKRERLGSTAAKLSLPLLRHRVQSSQERLRHAGLAPVLLSRRMTLARDGLAPVARVLPQLDPRLPLQRGYALVTDATGQALTSRDRAARESALVLEFRDGKLPVTVGSGESVSVEAAPAPSPRPRRPTRPQADEPRQGDLF
ncbi:exodeoxyribonuclease VII large subunit [Novosphingobium mangrovi (ex Huang et al. 2023)]|uniref:Exodeoxyribonuclease 7 large subunit n=1 Tax=Novosphingobium mangrovi (ex Huang et al. 2023) TaxID=2976432 RepID=A0ABT2I943_9SPHN|nr:exodeoxyribonuclease VII large subunit [Novosphingobium mangrovi (ex Huang et al. 2023)]MCT2401336.1 exodeoxyribonuclease VII large subunit [Novosphingobium mangrovi (ex Huang et al. 2023)]